MSTAEDKSNNNDDDNALNEDLENLNTGSEGDVASIPFLSPKIGDENVAAISKAKPVSPSSSISTTGGTEKQAGDTTIDKFEDIVKSVESIPEISKGSSDHTATIDADVDNIDTKTTSLPKGDKSDNNDDMAEFMDVEDNMELKWDDDEEDTQFHDAKDNTSEEQLLEDLKNDDSCENATDKGKEDSEDIGVDKSNINEENPNIISKDILKENNEEILKDKPSEEAEITTESESCTVIDNSIIKDVVKVDITEELLLQAAKKSSLDTPNVNISSEKAVIDKDFLLAETAAAEKDDNTKVDRELEEELLEDTDTNVESSEIIPDNKLLEATDAIKQLDSSEMDISMDKENEKEDEPSQAMDVDIEDQETAEVELQVNDKVDKPITDEKDNEPANRCSDADSETLAVDKPTNTITDETVMERDAELEKLLSENVNEGSIKDIDNIADENEQVDSNTDAACLDNSSEKELSKNITKDADLDKDLDSNVGIASCLDKISLQSNNPENTLESEKILTKHVTEDNSDTKTDNSTVICLDNSKTVQIDILDERQKTEEPVKLLARIVSEDNPKILDTISENLTILDDSPIQIKTDHALHKPDVMLEIPTQEIIDIEAELSMTIDHSPLEISEEKIADSVNEETVDQIVDVTVKENAVGQVSTVDLTANKTEDFVDGVPVEESSKEETIEESMEKMFAEDEPTITKKIECIPTTSQAPDIQPVSSNKMSPDTDEIPEISDSLGLLAESSGRLMEDDEEPEDDDDDEFDQDESSNQVSAEQSEDSNAPHSETEPGRDQEEKELDTPEPKGEEFRFTISNIESSVQEKENTDAVDTEITDVEVNPYAEQDETLKATEESEENSQEAVDKSLDQPMDVDTVKLSDTSDNEEKVADEKMAFEEPEVITEESQVTEGPKATSKSPTKSSPVKSSPVKSIPVKSSPAKMMKLEIKTLQADQVVNFVDLEESSSSEDDIQEVKSPEPELIEEDKPDEEGVTKVNIPTSIEIMCTSGGTTSEMVTKAGEVVISGIPKPPPHKPARLNTSEVTIKTVSNTEPLVIPETMARQLTQCDAPAPKLGLEIFSLDSDDDDSTAKDYPENPATPPMTPEPAPSSPGERQVGKCMNCLCPRLGTDEPETELYDTGRKGRVLLCLECAQASVIRTKKLVEDIKNFTPILDMDLQNHSQELVEISDSESEGDENSPSKRKDAIGEKTAKFLEENLAAIMNETWKKYDMDTRMKETRLMLDDELEKLEEETKELGRVFNECQTMTDYLRRELYASFEEDKREVPAISIVDKDGITYTGFEVDTTIPETVTRSSKRRLSTIIEVPAKRPAIPLGYSPIDTEGSKDSKMSASGTDMRLEDDKDISVVKLSAEAAPADLPPPGEISRPPLRVGMPVFAMKNAFGPWLKGKVLDVLPKTVATTFTLCRVKFDHKTKTNGKVLPARCIAYPEPADVRMTIGTRLIALFKDSNKRESYYSGVVAEIPNPVNNYRYLVFFDDGYAQYVQHAYTRLVCESSPLVWEEVHPFSREFVRDYLITYPERPMVRLHEGQHLKTEWNGKWWSSRVTRVDASLAQVLFVGDGRREWIYRGSTRLAPLYLELRAAERHRPRPMPRSKAQPRLNMPYVEYTRSDESQSNKQQDTTTQVQQPTNEEIRRQRAVAKKSTAVPPAAPPPPQPAPGNMDNALASRVVYYTPKHAVRPYKMVPHKCGPKCKRSDVLTLKDLRTYNPLAKPLLSGWERQIVRFKGHKEVMYRAPCGRRVRSMQELHSYLRCVDSELPVDLFDFHPATHCLAEFVHNKCLVGKKDLSHGKENVPVPCVNYYDDSLPEFCSYNTERTPTAGVPLNLDPEFLCGCDCTDDCEDKTKCACWKMTLEGARTIGLDGPNVGYVHKRLPEPLPSGIYECNSRCKCKHTCLNRVAQHPLQLKLQVFKTVNRGWGIRALNDVPKGSFLCVYAGNLLTDATANLDGLNEGDEYLAELDYIEVVEQMKEGYEEDIPDADKKLDKKETKGDATESEEEPSSSDEEESASKTDKEDDDFRPGYIGLGVMEFNKRLRRREKIKKEKEDTEEEKEKEKEKEKDKEAKESNAEEDCITISDDEEVREPSRFTVQAGMGANEFISKYRSVRSLFGKDEACYIMDAKVQGNIGRYLNHSCCPNVFVQNVFVDTHDPRFPWVAFFALSHIKAGTELTWNYNYDVGSVPGKILYCHCGAPNCRGRLL